MLYLKLSKNNKNIVYFSNYIKKAMIQNIFSMLKLQTFFLFLTITLGIFQMITVHTVLLPLPRDQH